MKLSNYISFSEIRIICKHLSGILASIIAFNIVNLAAEKTLAEGCIKDGILLLDQFALLSLYAWFCYQMGVMLWNSRVKIGDRLEIVLA